MAVTRAKTSSVAQGPSTSKTFLAGNPVILPGSYESIATTTLSSATASITFSSISSAYKHLQIRGIARTASGGEINLSLRLNGDTSGSYMAHNLQGDGSSAGGFSSSTGGTGMFLARVAPNTASANIMGGAIIDILDYANTNKNTTLRSLTGYDANGSGFTNLLSGLWINTNAVTSITIYNATGVNIDTNSTFALYGIK